MAQMRRHEHIPHLGWRALQFIINIAQMRPSDCGHA
ncbi:hypothetical protein ACVJBD_005670 [Rhizobium mongolense]